MSSTTDRSAERGQILVLFAGGLVALLLVAALAFDVGMVLLERRDQQNAADAAALAGARYIDPTQTFHGSCAAPGGNAAVIAACEVALANDFSDAASDEDVLVDIPPVHAAEPAHRAPWFIEVRIAANRPSLFAGVIGKAAWPVGVMAIAANQQDVLYPFGMLALNETACKAMQFAGTGVVDVASSIQSNSTGEDCPPPDQIAFSQTGGAQVDADGVCRAAGDIQDAGSGYLHCDEEQPFSFPVPDPLRNLVAPAEPPLAAPIKRWVGGVLTSPVSNDIPDYCPGKTTPANRAPEADDPRLCTMGSSSDGSAGGVFVMSPGLYPGGLEFKGGVTVYLLPGIYWIGGGGFAVAGDSTVISVKDETDTTPAVCTEGATPPCDDGGGGILIYNSKLSSSGPGAPKPITIGGGGGTVSLMPYLYPFPDNPDGSGVVELVIWQDRTVALGGDDVTLNGSTATATAVRGVIYLPNGDLKVNGSASEFTMDQVIAQTFYISGSGGTIKVLEEMGVDAVFNAAGLVE